MDLQLDNQLIIVAFLHIVTSIMIARHMEWPSHACHELPGTACIMCNMHWRRLGDYRHGECCPCICGELEAFHAGRRRRQRHACWESHRGQQSRAPLALSRRRLLGLVKHAQDLFSRLLRPVARLWPLSVIPPQPLGQVACHH